MATKPRAAKRRCIEKGGSAAAASGASAASGPLAGVAVYVRRSSLRSGAQLDAWKRGLPGLGAAIIDSDAACSSATHALVPTGGKGGWDSLPAALRPGSASMPAGLHYVTEEWMGACLRHQARMPEGDFAPAPAAVAPAPALVTPAATGTATQRAAEAAEAVAVAGGSSGLDGTKGDAECGGSSDSEDSSDELEEGEEGRDPARCTEGYARQAAQLVFPRKRRAEEDNVIWSLLSWNVWDCLDRQLFEERMLEVGREVARNEFPDVILLQEVSARTLGLLGRQPWLAAYHRSPLPDDIGRCCTVILLRKDRVRPPPGHREVQWLEPYVLKLNDDRGDDAAFERDVKSVRCSILGRPVRISTAHLIHYEGGRRQAQEIFDWLSDQDVLNKGLDQDHVLGGDFNWHYKHGMPLPAGWVDVWSELTRDAGQTWSSLARLGKDYGRVSAPARLDRVCAKLQSFRPIQIDNSTGSQPIEGAVRLRRTKARRGQPQEIPAYASDHRGIFTRFQLVPAQHRQHG